MVFFRSSRQRPVGGQQEGLPRGGHAGRAPGQRLFGGELHLMPQAGQFSHVGHNGVERAGVLILLGVGRGHAGSVGGEIRPLQSI